MDSVYHSFSISFSLFSKEEKYQLRTRTHTSKRERDRSESSCWSFSLFPSLLLGSHSSICFEIRVHIEGKRRRALLYKAGDRQYALVLFILLALRCTLFPLAADSLLIRYNSPQFGGKKCPRERRPFFSLTWSYNINLSSFIFSPPFF